MLRVSVCKGARPFEHTEKGTFAEGVHGASGYPGPGVNNCRIVIINMMESYRMQLDLQTEQRFYYRLR